MGYTTDFKGSVSFDRPLSTEHANYLRAFNKSRRMKRNPGAAEKLIDEARIAAGIPVGPDGCYYVGSHTDGNYGQNDDESVMTHNEPPDTQPGLWCQWTISEDNQSLIWDGGEKFYRYTEWLQYLITHFFERWGYKLNGSITWRGEDDDDIGTIIVSDSQISTE